VLKYGGKKKTLGSYPYFSVIFSVTLALFVIGLFGLFLLTAQKIATSIRENVQVQVYLDKNLSQSEKLQVHKVISSKAYILKKDNRPDITFISKEDAAKRFIDATGEDFVEFLGDNPLRDAYTIGIAKEYQDLAKLDSIKGNLNNINGVFEVTYVENLIDSINKNVTKISAILLGVSFILILTVIILIDNTIKLALFSQRFLIRSMQLVGAKMGFIRKPFLRRSLLHGFIAGVTSSVILYAILEYGYSRIPELEILRNRNQLVLLFSSLLALGSILSTFSTLRAVNKYLKMSLDELY